MRVFDNHMQTNHKPQQVYTEKAFKIMSSLFFSNPKLQFSDRHNSLYGYSDFLARLFEMCKHSQYADCVQLQVHKGCKEPVQAYLVRQVDAWSDKAGSV